MGVKAEDGDLTDSGSSWSCCFLPSPKSSCPFPFLTFSQSVCSWVHQLEAQRGNLGQRTEELLKGTERLRLEKTLRIIEPNHDPAPPRSPPIRVPRCHIQGFFGHFQGWELHHLDRQGWAALGTCINQTNCRRKGFNAPPGDVGVLNSGSCYF